MFTQGSDLGLLGAALLSCTVKGTCTVVGEEGDAPPKPKLKAVDDPTFKPPRKDRHLWNMGSMGVMFRGNKKLTEVTWNWLLENMPEIFENVEEEAT